MNLSKYFKDRAITFLISPYYSPYIYYIYTSHHIYTCHSLHKKNLYLCYQRA